jgi:RNA polymerase sigma-70 factor (ECF subfamily)
MPELVAQAQAGDEQCAGEIFDRYRQAIYRFFTYRVGSREDAEDLTQTTFLEMVMSLHRYRPQPNASFSSWLFRIARHRLIDYYRRKKTTVQLDGLSATDHPTLQNEMSEPVVDTRIQIIRAQMRRLPEKYQTILQLTLVEDLSLHEVAIIMEISDLHARVLKHRALKKIKGLMPDNSIMYDPL